jgi:hypothetical protein
MYSHVSSRITTRLLRKPLKTLDPPSPFRIPLDFYVEPELSAQEKGELMLPVA